MKTGDVVVCQSCLRTELSDPEVDGGRCYECGGLIITMTSESLKARRRYQRRIPKQSPTP